MAEGLADKFENALAKGFINIVILTVLANEPMHGYKIQKEIEEITMGVWSPPDSTLYTSLKSLTKNGLIEFTEESEGERSRKVYRLTTKGKVTYNIINERRDRITSILKLIVPDEDVFSNITYQCISSETIQLKKLDPKEKLNKLNLIKTEISIQLTNLMKISQKIDDQIKQLQ